MSQQEELMQFIDHSSAFLNTLPNLILIKDTDSRCVSFSNSLSRLLKMNEKKLNHRLDDDLPWHPYADIYRNCDKEALKGKSVSALQPLKFQKSKTWIANITKKPILNKEKKAIGILADATILPINSTMSDTLLTLLSCDTNHLARNETLEKNYLIDDYDATLKLTMREEQCLFLLLRGQNAKMIGKILSLSSRTVEHYIDNIKEKMSVSYRHEVIEKALELGLSDILPQKIVNSLAEDPETWKIRFQMLSNKQ